MPTRGPRNKNVENLPDGARFWKVGNAWKVVFFIPGTNKPMVWDVPDRETLKGYGGGKIPKADAVMTQAEFRKRGALRFGISTDITNTSDHPFADVADDWRTARAVRPSLRNPEVAALWWMAILEGREMTVEELRNTDWWNNSTAAERQWEEEAYRPGGGLSETARQSLASNRTDTANMLTQAGIQPSTELVRYIADRFTTGQITEAQWQDEIMDATDPNRRGANKLAGLDRQDVRAAGMQLVRHNGKTYIRDRSTGRVRDFEIKSREDIFRFGGVDAFKRVENVRRAQSDGRTIGAGALADDIQNAAGPSARGSVERVRELLVEWLGPQLAAGYSQEWIEQQASRLRQTQGNHEDVLIDRLRNTKKRFFAEYDDEATYEEIAAPWRSIMQREWGEAADEKDALFLDIIKKNDLDYATTRLRQVGMQRNIGTVVNNGLADLDSAAGDAVSASLVG